MHDDMNDILRDIGVGPANSDREVALFLGGIAFIAEGCSKAISGAYRDMHQLVRIAEIVRPLHPQLADTLIETYQRLSRNFDTAAKTMSETGERAKAVAKKKVWGKQ